MDYSAPKGMRDFLPQEMVKREWAIETIKSVYRSFGFVPMDSPALENVETLEKKCGEEIKGQLFRIDDGKLALRFDLTVPLARIASTNTFKKPLKRYCIGPVWRKEEPQKGRFREFYQADADIIGCASMRAEAELIAAACTAIEALGFSGPRVLLNDRRVISAIAKSILPQKETQVLRVLDKKDKVGKHEILRMLMGLGVSGQSAKELVETLTASSSTQEKLKLAQQYDKKAAADLEKIIELVAYYSKDINVEIDLSLARGLDYYTGPIFEIKLSDQIGSVGGGGRYDSLLSFYGQGDFAVGISLGLERLLWLMKDKQLPKNGVFVATAKPEVYPYAIKVASALRAAGISAQTDLNERNLAKQLEYAASYCKWAAILGQREEQTRTITLRELESGKEETVSLDLAVKKIKGH
ncbi:MAG: histidine--tRNA ligase [Candidatus Anstonellaceae archaeon]